MDTTLESVNNLNDSIKADNEQVRSTGWNNVQAGIMHLSFNLNNNRTSETRAHNYNFFNFY